MKPHRILKSFKGSQNGHDHHEFVPGPNPVLLSKDLAAIVVKEGWAEPVTEPKGIPISIATGEAEDVVAVHLDDTEIDPKAEEKAKAAAPANKAKKAAPENKKK
jgi:hypothetical protein